MTELENYKLQLEQAAAGLVSGSLAEWPMLKRAFSHHLWFVPNYADREVMISISNCILTRKVEKNEIRS
jgi:hypothetical protein